MEPYAFLFDAEELGQIARFGYHEPALRGFFEALLQSDSAGRERFLLLYGDLMAHELAEHTVAVRSQTTALGRHLERAQAIDRGLWTTIIWDVCDSIAGFWHTLELDKLPRLLGSTDIYVVAASSLRRETSEHADAHLRTVNGYLGAFAVDPGNPVHQQLTLGSLNSEPFYLERSLAFDP